MATDEGSNQTRTESTTLDRRWTMRMGLMTLGLAVFSLWGLYDATVAYPNRGMKVAESDLRELIRTAGDLGKSDQVSTPDPAAELSKLNDRERDQGSLNPFEQAKQRWLEALKRVGWLSPEHTVIANVAEKKAELEAVAATQSGQETPSRLTVWDIPAQWAIMGVCGVLALWLGALILRVASVKYRWDEGARALTLPDGNTITPSDIAEFDKRKWHKFLIELRVRPEHRTLGGKTVKLDLFRYAKLEGWVLEMEQASGLAVPAQGDAAPSNATPLA